MQFPGPTDADARLEQHARLALRSDERVLDCDVRVQVRERCASLAGVVPHLKPRLVCERVVSEIPGIRAIFNEISVAIPAEAHLPDETLRRMAATRMVMDPHLRDQRIAVRVHDRWLWLDGMVEHHALRKGAQKAAELLIGIRGVSNLLLLEPRPVPDNAQQLVERALARRMGPDAARIRVDVVGHTVYLHGTAISLRARRLAEDCVWVPGITRSENRIEIVE